MVRIALSSSIRLRLKQADTAGWLPFGGLAERCRPLEEGEARGMLGLTDTLLSQGGLGHRMDLRFSLAAGYRRSAGAGSPKQPVRVLPDLLGRPRTQTRWPRGKQKWI